MDRRDVLLNIIMYFNKIYKKPLDGRKKLQKLLFLVEHLDIESGKLSRSRGLTGYKFIVYSYGPFSKDVYRDLESLVKEGIVEERMETWRQESLLYTYIDDGKPRRIYYYRILDENRVPKLPREVEDKIKLVIEKYGSLPPMKLESHVNELLKLTPKKKVEYWGEFIDDYLEEEGFE
ncbi:type II toxin-antitoxin system antitoxin SocA domain-containing protein [Staphylothermus hellenicus]|uniref:Antitoxin SocA-like Panacea domain-containing protein n=1 Tax=Staphylothermus hellenicus (strain DSM 12710 / JCM 10830 / BK20S6-10-b1 / P8) TaxID=591019 RepID=D7DB01_STAHD|nr:type II toxin-antitoxin system antitoxin SocA domain-containing protein [Staphylothermus hellenicus]ADI31348.1 hypothetical protein Shell_0207 [Staphylothermus hellenicus DSM 12710]